MTLSKRGVLKTMSRPNAAKALGRIESELMTLLNVAPEKFGSRQEEMKGHAQTTILCMVDTLRMMYDIKD